MTNLTVPALSLNINLADIFSVMGSVWTSVWPLVALAIGAIFAFFLVRNIKSLMPRR